MDTSNGRFDPDELSSLVLQVLDGRASGEQVQMLDDAVVSSPAARQVFRAVVQVDSGLRWLHAGDREAAAGLSCSVETTQAAAARRSRLTTAGWIGSLALAASLALAGWFGLDRLSDEPAAGVLGAVQPISEDARWTCGMAGSSRSELRRGEVLMVRRGSAELRLSTGVVAQIEAPAVVEMVSIDCARMLKGRMTVDVPKGAEGFRVETLAASVIDLGTTFRVDASDDGETDVVVFQGKVDVVPGAADKRADDDKQRLLKGEGLRVSGDGTLSRIVNVRRDPLAGQRATPVVREVRDNIVRGETRKYYEIVTRGMREDAPAFVDRQHQWNGVSGKGMPNYLVGADYVMTFNDDKVVSHLEITLSLAAGSVVYLLVDDRLGPSEWLREHFEDTGDDVGIDEAPRTAKDSRTLASGAGKSVDQVHSVWRQRRPGGDSLKIDPLDATASDQTETGVKSKLNMFGIVVVPNAGG
jgi:hypothetical protein